MKWALSYFLGLKVFRNDKFLVCRTTILRLCSVLDCGVSVFNQNSSVSLILLSSFLFVILSLPATRKALATKSSARKQISLDARRPQICSSSPATVDPRVSLSGKRPFPIQSFWDSPQAVMASILLTRLFSQSSLKVMLPSKLFSRDGRRRPPYERNHSCSSIATHAS